MTTYPTAIDGQEWYWCDDCETCDCGGGFYGVDDDFLEPECPCCGGTDVNL